MDAVKKSLRVTGDGMCGITSACALIRIFR
jgi:hypothetical protein